MESNDVEPPTNAAALTTTEQSTDASPSNNSTPYDGCPDATQQPKSYLFKIAQELQDPTFDFAYPGDRNIIVAKEEWDASKHGDPEKYITHTYMFPDRGPYPGSTVESFLVSKKFFRNASKTWVKNQWFVPPNVGDVFNAWPVWAALLNTSGGILFEHLEKLEIATYTISPKLMDCFPSLKQVKMIAGEVADPYRTLMADAQLKALVDHKKAVLFRGLVNIQFEYRGILPRDGSWPPEVSLNLERMHELVMPLVTRQRMALRSPPPGIKELFRDIMKATYGSAAWDDDPPLSIGEWIAVGLHVCLVAVLVWAVGWLGLAMVLVLVGSAMLFFSGKGDA